VEQPHVQVLLKLCQRLAGRLRADAQRSGGLAQAAQLSRLCEDGNGPQFVDSHRVPSLIVKP